MHDTHFALTLTLFVGIHNTKCKCEDVFETYSKTQADQSCNPLMTVLTNPQCVIKRARRSANKNADEADTLAHTSLLSPKLGTTRTGCALMPSCESSGASSSATPIAATSVNKELSLNALGIFEFVVINESTRSARPVSANHAGFTECGR